MSNSKVIALKKPGEFSEDPLAELQDLLQQSIALRSFYGMLNFLQLNDIWVKRITLTA